MIRHGSITTNWGDGSHDFRLGLAEIEEIEAKCDKSLFVIAAELRGRMAKLAEIREVLRCGLIGGGMAPVAALTLVRRYLDERPMVESVATAYAVAVAGLARVHGDELQSGEAEAPEPNESTSGPSGETPS